MGKTTAVIDALWGDGGKGKIVDYLCDIKEADVCVRFNGGSNAGHSVETQMGDRFKVHLLPAGVFTPGVICVLGAGMIIDPIKLVAEIEALPDSSNFILFIDERAHLVLKHHIFHDIDSEVKLGSQKIGTTLTGNGPAYADKMLRSGIRIGDLCERLSDLQEFISQSNSRHHAAYSDDDLSALLDALVVLHPYVMDCAKFLNDTIKSKEKSVLFAGAHGTLLDIDYGEYPYVTSSSCAVSGIGVGAGVSPRKIDTVIGVVKAYVTRVGAGSMPTEMDSDTANRVRAAGKEFGTTTGRARRIGWLDLEQVKYAHMLNGFDYLAVTLLDVLSDEPELMICKEYRNNGTPAYHCMPGWEKDISECRSILDLPPNARRYLDFIEDCTQIPIRMISVGPKRYQIIDMR